MVDTPRASIELERFAWLPVLEEREDSPSVSKFHGTPFLSSPWPVCQSCAEPMLFLLQLKISELPVVPPGWLSAPEFELHREHGLIQIFNCVEPECALKTGDPYCGANYTALSYTWSTSYQTAARPGHAAIAPERVVVGWTKCTDRPSKETLLELDLEPSTDDLQVISQSHLRVNKLLGWPTSLACVDQPCCHLCGTKMTFLFQLTDLPVGENDAVGFLFVCPDHPNAAFAWGTTQRV